MQLSGTENDVIISTDDSVSRAPEAGLASTITISAQAAHLASRLLIAPLVAADCVVSFVLQSSKKFNRKWYSKVLPPEFCLKLFFMRRFPGLRTGSWQEQCETQTVAGCLVMSPCKVEGSRQISQIQCASIV